MLDKHPHAPNLCSILKKLFGMVWSWPCNFLQVIIICHGNVSIIGVTVSFKLEGTVCQREDKKNVHTASDCEAKVYVVTYLVNYLLPHKLMVIWTLVKLVW